MSQFFSNTKLHKRLKLVTFILWLSILFLSYAFNAFNIVSQSSFEDFQKPAESLIAGRLVRSEKNGILSDGGLLGWNHPEKELCDTASWQNGTPPFKRFSGWGYKVDTYPGKSDFQFKALENNLATGTYELYYSNPAGQAAVYSILGKLLGIKAYNLIWLGKILNALFSALIMTLFIRWSQLQYGVFVSFVAGLGILLSSWLTFYGNNVFYILGLFYLPFISSVYYLRKRRNIKAAISKHALLMACTVFLKCILSGFDFITVTLLMGFVPMHYYALLYKYPLKDFSQLFLYSGIGVGLGLVLSLVILAIQISINKGSFSEGMEYIIWTLERRSHGNTGYDIHLVNQDISSFKVIMGYWHTHIFKFEHLRTLGYMQIKFREICTIIFALSIAFLAFSGWLAEKRKYLALFISLWASILAPLSWFIIFKNHSQIHMHMNPVIWSMPFLLLAFVFIGVVLQNIWLQLAIRVKKRKSS